jgi:hypothetical protein
MIHKFTLATLLLLAGLVSGDTPKPALLQDKMTDKVLLERPDAVPCCFCECGMADYGRQCPTNLCAPVRVGRKHRALGNRERAFCTKLCPLRNVKRQQ